MKYLISSDFHLSEGKRLKDFCKSLSQIEKFALETKEIIDVYIIAGDIFDKRKPTPKELKIFSKHISAIRKLGVKILICLGNHDKIKEMLSTLSWLEGFGDIKIQKNFNFEDDSGKKIYISHRTVDEAKIGAQEAHLNSVSYKELTKSEKADIVILGHIHKPQIINSEDPLVFYPGSIERITFAERNDEKYFWFMDTNTDEITLIKNKLNIRQMKYIEMNIDNGGLAENGKKIKGIDVKDALVKVDVLGKKEKIKQINYDKLLKIFKGSFKLNFNFIYTDSGTKGIDLRKSMGKSDNELLDEYGGKLKLNNLVIKCCKRIIAKSNEH